MHNPIIKLISGGPSAHKSGHTQDSQIWIINVIISMMNTILYGIENTDKDRGTVHEYQDTQPDV